MDGVHHAANKYVFSHRLNVCSDMLLSYSVDNRLFHTAGLLKAKLHCATDVCTWYLVTKCSKSALAYVTPLKERK